MKGHCFRKRFIKASALLFGLTFFVFLPCLKNGFVNWDDPLFITQNPLIRSISLVNLAKIFSSFDVGYYQPLTTLSYAIDYHFFGLNSYGYHLTSFMIHLANTFLVFWLFLMISGKIRVAFLVGILFGIHPLHVESVAWLSERKDLVYSFFFLGSLLAYFYYSLSKKAVPYYLSLALFLLSILSKVMAMTLPLILFLMDYFRDRNNRAPGAKLHVSIRDKIPFLIVSCFVILVNARGHAEGGYFVSSGLDAHSVFSLAHQIQVGSYGLIFYLVKIFLPIHLSAFYYHPVHRGDFSFLFILSPVIVCLLGVAIYISERYTKKVIFGSLLFFFTLFPVLHFIPLGSVILADRYMYIPAIGIFYIFSEFFFWAFDAKGVRSALVKWILAACLTMFLSALMFMTSDRIRVWHDSEILWSDVLSKYPTLAVAYYNLGEAHFSKGSIDEAARDWEKAISLNPKDERAYVGLGAVWRRRHNFERALSYYDQAISINPNNADAYYNRGLAFSKMNQIEKAVNDYLWVVEHSGVSPVASLAYAGLADIFFRSGDNDRAIALYTEAIEADEFFSPAYIDRGSCYILKKEWDSAIKDFDMALKINPYETTAYIGRGFAYFKKKEYDKSWEDIRRAMFYHLEVPQGFIEELKAATSKKK